MTLTLERESEKEVMKKSVQHVQLDLRDYLKKCPASIQRRARRTDLQSSLSRSRLIVMLRISFTSIRTSTCARCLVHNTEFAATCRTT